MNYLEMGVFGAALALDVTLVINFALQELYLQWKHKDFAHMKAPLFGAETFQDWMSFLKLGVPGTMM